MTGPEGGSDLVVRAAAPPDAGWIAGLQDERWGGHVQVANGASYRPSDLPGFVAERDGERVGYAALRVAGDAAWIGLIDVLRAREGIGTALVRRLAEEATTLGCRTLRAITTNDNREAQAFYAALGFRLREIRPGAVNASRRLKPAIPLVGADGTPITDELEYDLEL